MKFFYKIILCCFFICCSACVKDLDFSQAEDIEIEPVIATSLLNFTIDQEDYDVFDVEDGVSVNQSIIDETLLPSFESSLIKEDLDKIVLQFEAANTFEGDITLDIAFLDDNNNVTYQSSSILIPANDEAFYYEEEVVVLNNPNIFNSKRVLGTLTYEGLIDGVTGNASLDFKSAGIFYFSIK